MSRIGCFASVALVVLCGSCAAIFGGTSQTVLVESVAPGRPVSVDGVAVCSTPCPVELERGASHQITVGGDPAWGTPTVTFRMEQSFRAGMLVLDILFTGLIGIVVDAATESWFSLDPVGATCSDDSSGGCAAVMIR